MPHGCGRSNDLRKVNLICLQEEQYVAEILHQPACIKSCRSWRGKTTNKSRYLKSPSWSSSANLALLDQHQQPYVNHYKIIYSTPIGSMGLVYFPTLMLDLYGKRIGKYTSPMDPMGYFLPSTRSGRGTRTHSAYRFEDWGSMVGVNILWVYESLIQCIQRTCSFVYIYIYLYTYASSNALMNVNLYICAYCK